MKTELRIKDVTEGDVLVSPWGTEVDIFKKHINFFIVSIDEEVVQVIDNVWFKTYFGGWRVK